MTSKIKDFVNFFPISVYPAAVFFVILLVVLRVTKKSMFSSLVEGIPISVFEFSFAKGSVTWNGSRKPRPCEPEQRFSVINTIHPSRM